MFARAYDVASRYTFPVITTSRYLDGEISSNVGGFVVLNSEGWILSAAHILNSYLEFTDHMHRIAEYQRNVAELQTKSDITAKQLGRRLDRLERDPKWITHHSFWWGRDDWHVIDIRADANADILVGRIAEYDPASIETYPVIKNPGYLPCGTSLCKLGFPFHEVAVSFDDESERFELLPGTLPIPRFPIEGILTRHIRTDLTFGNGNYPVAFLETSSPGLRGQSGGPIFDTKGTMWAIQSRTHHLSLGFSPRTNRNGREIEEHQFLNVGVGIHPEVIVNTLRDLDVSFEMSDY